MPSSEIISTAGGLGMILPVRSRPSTLARSNRNPSTCMSVTQYRRHVRICSRTAGWLQFTVFPVPL